MIEPKRGLDAKGANLDGGNDCEAAVAKAVTAFAELCEYRERLRKKADRTFHICVGHYLRWETSFCSSVSGL